MFFDTLTFVGLDPTGGRKPFTWAALDSQARLLALADGELDEALAFLGGLPQALIAVNAPPRPNLGLVREARLSLPGVGRALDMRLAEYELRQRGINAAATPSRRELCPGWMQTGFEFYRRLEALGYQPDAAEGAARRWLETQPAACFALWAGTQPLPRSSLEGRLQRQLILVEEGLRLRDPMDFFEELTRHKLLKGILPLEQVYTPEQLDALAAACLAWRAASRPAEILRLGDPAEGQMTLPAG
ncbi:MAG: hypothetical protein OHK0031_05580 [Anaerolineales bacterium]